MSDYDLTEAVEAAADAFALSRFPDARPNDGMTAWESMRPEVRALYRELVLPAVAAAAPFIVAQVEADECAHTALSLIYHRERNDARDERDAALATIGLVRALVEDPHAALVVDRIRAALEMPS
jgi:hypothetical protein